MSILLNDFIKNELKRKLFTNTNLFDEFCNLCESFTNKECHSIQDIKKYKNNKNKGILFEHFCKLYFKSLDKYKSVWLYNEFSITEKNKLNLTKNDFGIDIICQDFNNKYYAIQCKYRKRNDKRKTCIPWRDLATFYGQVANSGPFEKHIVITNADYINHIGKKTNKDITINYNILKNINNEKWKKILDIKEIAYKLSENSSNILSNEEIIKKRLEYFNNK